MKKIAALLIAFCLLWGTLPAMAASTWKCPECKSQNNENYCGDCGTKRPDWTCAGCKRKIVTKYCVYCGMPKVFSDGIYAMEKGDYDTAIDCFLATQYGDYRERLAEAYYAKGDQLAARKEWGQAIGCLEDSYFMHLKTVTHHCDTVYDLPERLQITMLTLAHCYLSYGDKALEEGDWEKAGNHYLEGIAILERFASRDLALLPDVHAMFSQPGYKAWDDIFYAYAQKFEGMGEYAAAVKLYEHVSWAISSKNAAQNKLELQEKYAKQFNLETMYAVCTSDGYYIGKYQMDEAYAGDYSENQTLHPALRITNSDASQTAAIYLTAKYAGKTYYWGDIKILPRRNWNPYLDVKALPAGGDFCEWYFDDVLVARIKYDVIEGKSDFKGFVVDRLKTEMELCLWNDASETVQEAGLKEGTLNLSDTNMMYAPRLKVTNNYWSDVDVVVSLRLNGQDAVVWNEDTVAEDQYERYIYTSADHVEGENICIWYINGIEVLRDSYTMIRVPEETEAPTAEPTAEPTTMPTTLSTFMPFATPAPSANT